MVEEFIGRDHELAVMARLRARALTGRRQVAVVSGEAGIGKTWFCERATADAERDGFDVVWGRCWPHAGAPALWPWPAVLADLIGASGAGLLADDPGAGERVAPERFARFAAVADRLKHARAGTPTMVVLDDLHNAGAGALLLTRFLTRALDRLPLVLLLARRDGGAETLLDELARDATAVPLRRFTVQDAAALLSARGQRGDDHRVTTALLQVTGGIPLFLAHAIGRGWDTGPTTVRQAITDALARLPARTRRLLALGAVLGVEPAVGDIAELAEQPPTDVAAALAEAADGGLVDLSPSGCAFHDPVREAALAQLDTSARLDIHARAAALLAGTGRPERVAHHALAAAARSDTDALRAIDTCREAATSLRRGFAYEQAAMLLQRAVQLAEQRPVGPERTELLLERAETVLGSVSLALGVAAMTTGDPDAAVAYLEHAVEANQRWGHRPATALCNAELADALLLRGRSADLQRAATLLNTAVAEARAMALTLREQEWSARAAALRRPMVPAVLRQEGKDGWTVEVGPRLIALPCLIGLRYLGILLTHPGENLPATDLCAAVSVVDHEVLDRQAVATYRRRLHEIDAEIDDADADADLGRAERLRLEREALTAELTGSLGLGGRARNFGASTERARTSVRKAVKRALDVLAEADPALGAELRVAISTGATCRYDPAGPHPRQWRVETGGSRERAGVDRAATR
ncbi:MAG: AAA family ATPase [Pseudonocardiaceae bacterium]